MSKKSKRKPAQRLKKPRATPPFELKDKGLLQAHRCRLYSLLECREYAAICHSLVTVLDYFQKTQFRALGAGARRQINDFVSAVFLIFSDDDFTIPDDYVPLLLARAHLFANVVALSDYNNTDPVVRQLLGQPGCFVRLLFLLTARNTITLSQSKLFDINKKLASLWFFTYPLPSVGCCTRDLQDALKQHYDTVDPRFRPFDHRVAIPYFYSTYFASQDRADARVKRLINMGCREVFAATNVRVVNEPNPKKIAIVTSKWFPNSAVYKSCAPLIKQLKQDHDLILIHTGPAEPSPLARETFDKIERVYFDRDKDGQHSLQLAPVLKNDYQVVYYLDVGMTDESIWLSNLRLAPIQATSYGHPVSTFGSEIDYFFVGDEVEVADDFEKNYSEVPVVLPGSACTPTWPNYIRKDPPKTSARAVANCVWGPEKYNHTLLNWLKEVQQESGCEFAIFTGPSVCRYNALIPFVAEIKQALGDSATVHCDKEYLAYMEAAEQGDFAINSYPFGGYNTVVEALYLGKPVVTLEGDRFYNRVASYLLRQVGLDHLIAETPRQFITLCSLMASDAGFLETQKEILAAIDLKEALFKGTDPDCFVQAIDYLIANHAAIQEKPVRSIHLP